MANNIQQQIEARVQAFVLEVSELVRSSALDAVASALGGGSSVGGGARRGRPVGSKNKASGAAAAPAATGKRGKRGKRTSEEVDAMAARILEHVKKNPGANVEGMAKAFNLKSKDLTLPINKLLTGKKVKTVGQRRGTKYHAR